MIAYKAFEPGLVCRRHRFQMGVNRTEKANCLQNGFHCAENPFDCLTYYSDIHKSEYYLVDARGDIDEDDVDTKIACTELIIIKRLSIEEFFLHGLAYMVDHPHQKWSHVNKDSAQAHNGYALVRGSEPVAKGKLGDILAFAKEDITTGHVIQLAYAIVDGKEITPDTWYGVDLIERGCDKK